MGTPFRGRGFAGAALLAALAAAGASLAGCASHASRIAEFRESWGVGDYAGAEKALDVLLAAESGASPEVVTGSRGLDPSIRPEAGNTFLLLLEKSMARLARGDPEAAVELLRRGRDQLDRNYRATFQDFFAGLQDDEAMDYAGADYEHVLVRLMLSVTDLLAGGGDAYAYALQVGEKQEEIIGSDFGWTDQEKGLDYHPRRQYQRVAAGAYLQGVIQEANLASSEAALAFERGLSYGGENPALRASLERARSGKYAPEGCGVLHVLYLGGRGPHLEQTTGAPGTHAIQLAAVGYSIATGTVSQFGQAAIPVPMVVVTDPLVVPLPVSVDGGEASVATVPILDVNAVAVQQLQANMPGIMARALVRRAVKGAAGAAVEGSVEGDTGALAGFLTTLLLTSVERAETRNWTSLPAQFQVARVPVPEGEHRVSLGPGMDAGVRITKGRDSFLLVLRPNQALPGVLLADVHSRPLPRPPAADLPEIPAPAESLPAAPSAPPAPGGKP
jgi:hypothetical protein